MLFLSIPPGTRVRANGCQQGLANGSQGRLQKSAETAEALTAETLTPSICPESNLTAAAATGHQNYSLRE